MIVLSRLLRLYKRLYRYVFDLHNRMRLRNKEFSVISKDCAGGVILNSLHVKFDSPTVNLWFNAQDFVKFCRELKYYISAPLLEDMHSGMSYPVGILGEGEKEIKIYFMHYDTFTQAKDKWDERKTRIHWDNLYFIMTDREGCNEELAREFDALPYEHKALLTFRDFDGVKSAVKLDTRGVTSNNSEPPLLLDYPSRYSPKRLLDYWDYVNFLNS